MSGTTDRLAPCCEEVSYEMERENDRLAAALEAAEADKERWVALYVETARQCRTVEAKLAAIDAAWNNDGPVPTFHRHWQSRLRHEWPTLANAIERAVSR